MAANIVQMYEVFSSSCGSHCRGFGVRPPAAGSQWGGVWGRNSQNLTIFTLFVQKRMYF